jgi:uncharacterized membrane protein
VRGHIVGIAPDRCLRMRTGLRLLLALLYFVAGVIHLRAPGGFVAITPDWVPFRHEVVLLTGLCEIAGAIGLLTNRFRAAAGIGLALYAVCVFPANINHALNNVAIGGVHMSWWYHAPRLALQPLFVWWALWAGGVIDWPWRARNA